ncbi:MAG: biopolymer transporter ExbD [Pseudomonadota bacterium]|nr:biopolymer transporter ExbD [Pseudomonadota bacterium]
MNLKKISTKQKDLSETINLIPMINLIFLLLIFFLLTGVIQKKERNDIERPSSNNGIEKELTGNEILLTIKDNNKFVFENNIISYEQLDQIIHSSDKRYLVDIDKDAKISTFNNLIKKFKEKKIKKIFLKVVDLKEVDD